ncbi:MAG: RHS repeat-associated core domain-containing protein [Bacteroidia bacterium]
MDRSTTTSKHYFGSIEYNGSTLEALYHEEGRAVPDGNSGYDYEYAIRDHLGSTRVMFEMVNGVATILQESHTYPFGMELSGPAFVGGGNPYRYTGKELETDLEIGLYDYGARWYDPAAGRWWGVDALGEDPNQVEKSPFSYAWNNPISLTDPDGRCPFCPVLYAFAVGFGFGAGADATVQVATNKIQGKGAFEDYSVTSTVISGLAGGFSGGTGGIANTTIRTGVNIGIVATESVSKQIITDDAVANAAGGDFSTIQENVNNVSTTQVASDVIMDKIGGNVKVVGDAKIKVMERQLDRTTRVARGEPSSSGRVANQKNAQGKLNNANGANTYVSGTVGNGLQNVSDATRNAFSIGGNPHFSIVPPQPIAQDNTRVKIILPINP